MMTPEEKNSYDAMREALELAYSMLRKGLPQDHSKMHTIRAALALAHGRKGEV